MNILRNLDWLKSNIKDAKGDDVLLAAAAKGALAHHAISIGESLLEVADSGDDVVHEVQARLLERSRRGMETYGVSMQDDKETTTSQWIDHAIEESLDAANYLTKLKRKLNVKSS